MLYELLVDVSPRGEDGETLIGGLVNAGTYVDGRFRKWVKNQKGWLGETHAWNALVISGPWAGAVMHFAASALRLVNKQDDAVRYGMVEAGNTVSMKRCAHCGEPAAQHTLKQDGDSRGSLIELRAAIKRAQTDLNEFRKAVPDAKGKMPALRSKVMIGVLITKRQECWAAHSGEKDDAGIKAIVEKVLRWKFAGMDAVQAPIYNKRAEEATDGTVKGTLQKFKYQCAAPKLIQAAIKDKDKPFAMTEAFFNEADGAGPQASCARCANTVRYMLCPD